jgi:Acetyl-CoA hydrolase/transferase C-terminal domain
MDHAGPSPSCGRKPAWDSQHGTPAAPAPAAPLVRALVAQRARLGRIRVFLGIGCGKLLSPEHADAFDMLAYCGTGTNWALAEAGVLDILPVHYSQLPRLIQRGPLRVDVVLLQVSPPDTLGRYSLGMAREYLVDALNTARTIIAEVHPDVPWTYGGPYLYEKDFSLLASSAEALPSSNAGSPGPVEMEIGRHVAGFVEDGATLQAGIGSIPDAVLAALRDRRDLGAHSGSIGNGFAQLHEAGVLTNSCKSIDPGVSIGGVLIGDARLRRFAHRNPALELRSTDYTHNARVLGGIDRFVAINSAIEVDLTGRLPTLGAAPEPPTISRRTSLVRATTRMDAGFRTARDWRSLPFGNMSPPPSRQACPFMPAQIRQSSPTQNSTEPQYDGAHRSGCQRGPIWGDPRSCAVLQTPTFPFNT